MMPKTTRAEEQAAIAEREGKILAALAGSDLSINEMASATGINSAKLSSPYSFAGRALYRLEQSGKIAWRREGRRGKVYFLIES